MTHRSLVMSGLPILFFVACGGSQPPPEQPPPPAPAAVAPAPVQSTAAAPAPAPAAPAAEAKPPEPPPPTPVFRVSEGIQTPESVLYEEGADRYLVSNINGKPADVDNNGYISEISPEGKVIKDKFIAGGTGKVKLDAPKGMGITGGVLYVADITVVRKFDAKSGAPKGEIAVPGSTFLNDIAVSKDGKVYVSDTGVDKNFAPTGTDAVYEIDKGKVKPLAKGKELEGPNGLLVWEKSVLVAPFGGKEIYRLDEKGMKQDVTPIPAGQLDGIVHDGDSILVSSWEGKAVYKGKLGGKFEPVLSGLSAPADIGFDTKRKRVLVPRFMDNAVEVYELK